MNCTGAKCHTAKKGKGIACNEFIKLPERGGRCAKRSLECRREQENHSQKVCNANKIFQLYQGIDISTKKRSTKMPLCLAFGTGESLLWYGICVPCSKRLPGVRDAFSEAFGVKNRLFRYGRDIRCQKQPSVVRDEFSKARRTADSTDCGQPPGVRDASSEACRAKSSLLPHRTHLQCAKRPPRSLFAPAAPSLAPSTALGTRNGPARR